MIILHKTLCTLVFSAEKRYFVFILSLFSYKFCLTGAVHSLKVSTGEYYLTDNVIRKTYTTNEDYFKTDIRRS